MMTNAVFYLALVFCLGTCAVVNIEPEIKEGKTDELINDLVEIADDLQFAENLIQNSDLDLLENTNKDVKHHAPMMFCVWNNKEGLCRFKFYGISEIEYVTISAMEAQISYVIKSGDQTVATGYLSEGEDNQIVDIRESDFKLKLELKLRFLSLKGIVMCFNADYHTSSYGFNGEVGCTVASFHECGPASMSIM